MRRTLVVLMAVGLLMCFSPAVASLWADSISASGGTGTSAQSSCASGTGGWYVEDSGGGFQDIYYDPNAGPWNKNLAAIAGGAVNGGIYQLMELLHVGGGPQGNAPAWIDYHEEILTPGWTWSPAGPQGQAWSFASGTYIGVVTYVVPMGNTKVDWSFKPAMPVCTNFVLTKYLVFNGGAGTDPNAPVVVAEYPTVPEPATMSLLGLGLAGLVLRRRRK